MSVEFESKNRIANLISAANAKTGGTEADLTSAIGLLIAGFGQGGESSAPVIEALDITANGTYTAPDGVDGYSPVTVNIPTGGESSGGALYSGTFTPAENELEIMIEVPGELSHFLMYAENSVIGNSVKATAMFFLDCMLNRAYAIPTNNSGSSLSAWTATEAASTGPDYKYRIYNNTRVTIYENYLTISTATPSGTCLGYFIAGVTYQWYAW